MAVLRLASGPDIVIKLSVTETIVALEVGAGSPDFVELPGDEGPIFLRPSGVIAVIEDARRGTAGFRLDTARAAE
jgi:hypothetical protein